MWWVRGLEHWITCLQGITQGTPKGTRKYLPPRCVALLCVGCFGRARRSRGARAEQHLSRGWELERECVGATEGITHIRLSQGHTHARAHTRGHTREGTHARAHTRCVGGARAHLTTDEELRARVTPTTTGSRGQSKRQGRTHMEPYLNATCVLWVLWVLWALRVCFGYVGQRRTHLST